MVRIGQDESGLHRTVGAGIDLAFQIKGDGPAVVLLHGTSANHAVWEPVADELVGSATVISLDQRGHGRSDKPDAGYDGISFADDVMVVLNALGLESAIVAGHSLGARNAWVAAARHPERVSAVLAIDYTPYVEKPALDALAIRVAAGDRVFPDVPQIESYLSERYPRMPLEAVRRRAKWGYRQLDDGSWAPLAPADALALVVEGLRTPWDREFQAVRAPMTCMRGVDSGIVSPSAWDAAQRAHPGARWVVAETDHYLPEEAPELVVAELERLLGA